MPCLEKTISLLAFLPSASTFSATSDILGQGRDFACWHGATPFVPSDGVPLAP